MNRTRKRQASPQVYSIVVRMAGEGFGPAAIHRELEREGWPGMERGLDVRTIQRMVKELDGAEPDTSGPWSFTDAEPDEARRVLDVAAFVVDATDGRLWLTRELAGWVSRVRQASPCVPPAWAYALARAYRTLSKQPPANQDARPLDTVLAAEPWRSEDRAAWYQELVIRTARQEQAWAARQPAERRRAELARRRGETFTPSPRGVNLASVPTGLRVDVAALLETRPGGPAGSLGNPWPPVTTPITTPKPLDSDGQT